MIYVSDNKAILCKGDFRPAQFYKGKKKIAGYEKVTIEDERTTMLENCYNDRLYDAKIYGDTIQDGEPSPDNPIEVQSVGDLVTEGEHSGKYRIGVVARGKNLLKAPLDINSWGIDSTISSHYSYKLNSMLPINKAVTLSFDCTTVPTYFYFLTDDENIKGNYEENGLKYVYITTTSVIRKTYTFTPREGKSYYLYSGLALNNTSAEKAQSWLDRFTYMQIEYGSEATEYEEYKEPQHFDIYLDEPLRKVEGYEDYIDFEKGVVVRNLKEYKFTGEEYWEKHLTKNFMFYINQTPPEVYNSSAVNVKSSRLKSYLWAELYGNTNKADGSLIVGVACTYNRTYGLVYVYACPYTNSISVDEWGALLQQWNDEGNPFTVIFAIGTTEERIDLPQIPTFKGTTVYEIDTQINAKISGEYKKVEE